MRQHEIIFSYGIIPYFAGQVTSRSKKAALAEEIRTPAPQIRGETFEIIEVCCIPQAAHAADDRLVRAASRQASCRRTILPVVRPDSNSLCAAIASEHAKTL
jgi:hypothetical protein